MARALPPRLGDFSAMARVVKSLPNAASQSLARQRKMVADFCRLLGAPFSSPATRSFPGLTARHQQTLERLLAGDSEKQIARQLGISRNTVHVYVTALYRHFEVSSRAELLSRFVRPEANPIPPAPSPFDEIK